MAEARCESCGAPVRWVRTSTYQWMPIDPDPVEGGNLALTEGTPSRVRVVTPGQGALLEDEPRYVSHFVTCPDAEEHRR